MSTDSVPLQPGRVRLQIKLQAESATQRWRAVVPAISACLNRQRASALYTVTRAATRADFMPWVRCTVQRAPTAFAAPRGTDAAGHSTTRRSAGELDVAAGARPQPASTRHQWARAFTLQHVAVHLVQAAAARLEADPAVEVE